MTERMFSSRRTVHQNPSCPDRFVIAITTSLHDLLPLALEIAGSLEYDQTEMIEDICKVNDKFYQYPPTKNRTAWFRKVFKEKLREARSDILSYRAKTKYFQK